MKTICKKCGRKMTPIFSDHIYNGSEGIEHGNERIWKGSENICTGHEKEIENYTCPFCNTKHKSGYTIHE